MKYNTLYKLKSEDIEDNYLFVVLGRGTYIPENILQTDRESIISYLENSNIPFQIVFPEEYFEIEI